MALIKDDGGVNIPVDVLTALENALGSEDFTAFYMKLISNPDIASPEFKQILMGGDQTLSLAKKMTQQVPGTGGISFGAGGGDGFDASAYRLELRTALRRGPFGALPFDVSKYINEAVKRRRGMDFVVGRIMEDKRFKKAFPGIFRKDGSLRMAPTEYLQREDQLRSAGAMFGLKPSKKQIGQLIAGDVSENEAAFRFQAIQTARANPQVLGYLKEQGVKNPMDFFFKKADQTVYDTYERAVLRSAAKSAGIELDAKRAAQIAGGTEGAVSLQQAEERYQRIAQQVRLAGVELGQFGLSARELETIEFGGPDRIRLATMAEQALKNREAQINTESIGAGATLTPTGAPRLAEERFAGI